MEEHRPKVGVGVMIVKEGKILLGKRLVSHGVNEYSFPGGHLEHLESVEECAVRETREEAGIEIQNIRFVCLTNIANHPPKHYLTIGMVADWKSGEPSVMEPDKSESWAWYDLENLPAPLFNSIPNFIKAYKGGKIFYDLGEL
jgi:8-oxo-dGTP diphosphatase